MNATRLCIRAFHAARPETRRRLTNQARYLNARRRGASALRARLGVHLFHLQAKWRAWLFVVLT